MPIRFLGLLILVTIAQLRPAVPESQLGTARMSIRATVQPMKHRLHRREFLSTTGTLIGGAATSLMLGGCFGPDSSRYSERDAAVLVEQQLRDRAQSGKGRFGIQRFRGYRGLADLPWFELDATGTLRCVDESVPMAIDMHCHLGMSLLFKPDLDLQASSDRVRHLLDCDATDPGCELDLDLYINGNFTEDDLPILQHETIGQAVWGSEYARTHTIPNLLAEMDATRVEKAMILPIKFDFPFGDNLAEDWQEAIQVSETRDRLVLGASVHPHDDRCVEQLEAAAKAGARIVKLHPPMQAFYPDEPDAMRIYEAAERLGMIIFYHGGRAGIEPESRHSYAMPRHYEGAVSNFPNLPFVFGHAGARDGDATLELGMRFENAWFDIHGQGITHLDKMIERTGGERMLFGTDWPFYHLAASLAKVLIVTDSPDRMKIRHAILRGNAERLLGQHPS
jgi:predicted TIM-barrel fold metal-dependent hydrolase